MAAIPETSFADLLAADSDFVMPTADKDVQDALTSFGAAFKKTRGDIHAAARADLLAGLALLHTHHADLGPVLPNLSAAQQERLAIALGLDFKALGALASWPALMARRTIAHMAPGLTPLKRRPDSSAADGQIIKPGGSSQQPEPPAPDASKKKQKKKAEAAERAKVSSSADSSGGDSDSDLEIVSPPSERAIPAAELMPAELGFGPAFDALVVAGCARRWATTDQMELCIPACYLSRLFRARQWSSKARNEYDKMINRQTGKRFATGRREDPKCVAFPHRLKFAFTLDECLPLDAEHIRLVCEGERLSDWAGDAGRKLGGNAARTEFKALIDDLRSAWDAVNSACHRLEHVGGPAVQHLIDQFTVLLERRYGRFAKVLPAGRPREEILANVARQLGELRTYFVDFNRVLADRAARLPYADQARFAGERYVNLFTPSMRHILGEEGGSVPGGIQLGDGGGDGPPHAPSHTAKSPRGILKPQSLAVSFGDAPVMSAAGPALTPAMAPQLPPAAWPYFQQFPPPYAVPGGLAFTPTPNPHESHGPPAWQGPGSHSGGSAPAVGGPLLFSHPPAAPAYGATIRAEPAGQPRQGKAEKGKFLGQPQHAYVTGSDCAIVPEGEVWSPPCSCGNHGGPSYQPGPHATWDCPLRYFQKHGRCPGFLANGARDPSQWLAGNTLTREAKDAWLVLLRQHNWPLPREPKARPPPFHL